MNLCCPVCSATLILKYQLKFKVYECHKCELLSSDAVFDHSFSSNLQVHARDIGLQNLRFKNFATIIKTLKRIHPSKNINGLEIGCGNGWWLKSCKENDIKCVGIEPEKTYAAYHQTEQLDVHYGFYPSLQVADNTQYDFIIFNDVFEHIPNIDELIVHLNRNLKNDGTLIINLPISTGLFYQMAVILHKFGVSSFLERLWQFHFHSPHMNYFNDTNLELLLQKNHFTLLEKVKLESLDYSSLKERISTDKDVSNLKASVLTFLLRLISPLIALAKPDIKVFFFKKNPAKYNPN